MRIDLDALYVEGDLVEVKVSMGLFVVGVFWVYVCFLMVGKSEVLVNVGINLVSGIMVRCVFLVLIVICLFWVLVIGEEVMEEKVMKVVFLGMEIDRVFFMLGEKIFWKFVEFDFGFIVFGVGMVCIGNIEWIVDVIFELVVDKVDVNWILGNVEFIGEVVEVSKDFGGKVDIILILVVIGEVFFNVD